MLIESLLIGVIGGAIGCSLNIISSAKDKEKEIDVDNIIKYEYIPTELNEKEINEDFIKYSFVEGEKEGIKTCIGYDLEGNEVILNVLDGHILIGGMTGAGKSNLLNIIITNIMLTYTENEVFMLGCDYTESDIYYFRRYKHFKRMATDKEGFLDIVRILEDMMKERAEIFDKTNCRNAINYNEKHDKKMSYIVVIVDELVQFVTDSICKSELHRIMGKCRKYGIYFILGGQDATKETIGKCKMNCPQVIGLKTFDETDSNTLIGKNQNLQDIKIDGRCKVKNKNGIIETQIMYLEEDEIDKLLKDNIKQRA